LSTKIYFIGQVRRVGQFGQVGGVFYKANVVLKEYN